MADAVEEMDEVAPLDVPDDDNVKGLVIRTEGGCVHILPEDLQETPFDLIVGIFQAEWARPRQFIRLAEEYYKLSSFYPPGSVLADKYMGLARDALESLVKGVANEEVYVELRGQTEAEHRQFDEDMLVVYNMLAALATRRACLLPKDQESRLERQQLHEAAKGYFDKADGVQRYAERTLLNTAWAVLNISEGNAAWRRADYYFTNAKRANEESQASSRRPNLLALTGMGILAFHGEVQTSSGGGGMQGGGEASKLPLKDAVRHAKRFFADVIRLNPRCPASVRVGYGLACYRLGDYKTALYAFQRALALEPGNKEALLGLARTTLMQATPEQYDQAQESVVKMITAAYLQDEKNACACNSLAKYYLGHWLPLTCTVTVVSDAQAGGGHHEPGRLLQADVKGLPEMLRPNSLIRVGRHFTSVVERVEDDTILLKKPLPAGEEGLGGPLRVYKKDLEKAMRLAERGRDCAEFPEIRAESYYIMARVFHQLEDLGTAMGYYREAVQQWPDLDPAQFGLAQMLAHEGKVKAFSSSSDEKEGGGQKKLDEAIAALERVLEKNPNDPDTLHLMGLLYSDVTRKVDKAVALEKLRRAIDAGKDRKDTWIALAQVHQREPPNFSEATRCYQEAERLMLEHKEAVPFTLYHNLGTLSHHSGDLDDARKAYVKALETYAASGGGAIEGQYVVEEQAIVHPANSVFWKWDELPGLTILPSVRQFIAEVNRDDWRDLIKPGDHIRLQVGSGDREAFVTEVEMDPAGEARAIKMAHTYLLGREGHFPVSVKRSRGLLRLSTLATAFNLAVVQEELGETQAAMELLQAIIRQYPSYTDAYTRLALLLHAQGHPEKAKQYIERARHVAPDNKDLIAIQARLEFEEGRKDQAQEKFTHMNTQHADPFAQVALGNMYFTNAIEMQGKEKHMGHAFNFFTKCLKKEPANVYAAHGLALTLAERGSVTDALTALQYIREKSPDKPDEVLLNLAHVDLAVNKTQMAVHCYQTWLKRHAAQGKGLSARVLNYLAHAHYKAREDDKAINALLKSLHIEPESVTHWFNMAMLLEQGSLDVFRRSNHGLTTGPEETVNARADMNRAIPIFRRPDVANKFGARASSKAKYLEENQGLAIKYVERDRIRFQREEAKKQELHDRAQQEEAKRQEEKRRQEEEERARREKVAQEALARQQKFEEMQSEWQRTAALEAAVKGKKGKKGKQKEDELEESDVDEPGAGDKEEEGDEEEEEDSGGDSSGEEYGLKKDGKGKGKKKKGKKGGKKEKGGGKKGGKGKKAAAKKKKEAEGAGPGEDDDEAGKKRKAEEEQEGGAAEGEANKKKRRVMREDESDEEEEELDLDTEVMARASAAEQAPAAMEVAGQDGEGAAPPPPAATRKKIAHDDEDEDEDGGGKAPAVAAMQVDDQQEPPTPGKEGGASYDADLFGNSSDEEEKGDEEEA